MNPEKELIETYKQRLALAMNKVPQRVNNGSIETTRAWLESRKRAEKLLKKRDATATQLISAIGELE
jgi:ribosomal protein L17